MALRFHGSRVRPSNRLISLAWLATFCRKVLSCCFVKAKVWVSPSGESRIAMAIRNALASWPSRSASAEVRSRRISERETIQANRRFKAAITHVGASVFCGLCIEQIFEFSAVGQILSNGRFRLILIERAILDVGSDCFQLFRRKLFNLTTLCRSQVERIIHTFSLHLGSKTSNQAEVLEQHRFVLSTRLEFLWR